MKIRMLRTQYGSPDGVTLLLHEGGKEYDLSGTARAEDLAAVFIREGWAEPADVKPLPEEKAAHPVVEDKAEVAPDNKAIEVVPMNKATFPLKRSRKG